VPFYLQGIGFGQQSHVNNMDQIPPFLLSATFHRRMLWVRHGLLLLFQLAGLCMLAIVITWLFFADPSAHSPDAASPAAPWWDRLWPIGFVLGWNAFVFLMLRQSSRMLRLSKDSGEAPKARLDGGDGHHL
jgi:hypothetical protein